MRGRKMPADVAEVESRSVARHAGDAVGSIKPRMMKLGYIRFLSIRSLDGRTRAAQRTKALVKALESDLGGADQLSEGERQLVQRAAPLGALIEDFEVRWSIGEPIELSDYIVAVNAQRRLLMSLGLERRQRNITPDVKTYLADAAARHAAQEAAR